MKIVSADITGSLIVNNVDVTTVVVSSSIWSGSIAQRVTNLENWSSSLDDIYATDASVTASILVLSQSVQASQAALSSSYVATSGSFLTTSASYAAASASLSTRVTTNETNIITLTSASASFAVASGSLSTRVTNLEATSSTVSSSFATTSGSISSRVTLIEGQYATTGSNTFTAPQQISDVSNAIGFTSTASLYTDGGLRVGRDSYVSGTAYFNNIVVYGTSSVQYTTSSQVNVGASIINLNTQNPAVRYGGIAVADSGSNAGVTGSLLWDSQNNRWIYSNPSGSSYDGGMIISGPRNTSGLGNEQGTLSNYVMKGQGGDHITSSQIIDDGTTVRIPGALQVTGSVIAVGSLGIGTSPITYSNQTSLTMNGTNVSRIDMQSSATTIGTIYTYTDNSFNIINATSNGSLVFNTNSANRMFITSGGNVGIGISSPSVPLHILRYAGSSGTLLLEGNDNVVGLPAVTFKNNNGGATSYVSMTAGGNLNLNGVLYTSGSNVGVGTTTPAAKLDVNGTGNYSSTLIANSSGGYSNGGSALNIESNSWAIVDANVKRQMQRVIGYVGDYEQHVILLHPIYNGTLIEFNKCTGTIFATRGWTYAGRINDTYQVDTSAGYSSFSGALQSNIGLGQLYTCLYNGVKYMALIPQYRTSAVVYHFDGYIANNSGGSTLQLVTYRNSNTGTIVNSEIYNSLTPYTADDTFTNGLLYPRQGVRFASGATTLNYYEEGTFTPTNLNSNFASVTPVWGRYTRIGNQVTVNCRWTVNANSTGRKYLVFNLPFAFSITTNVSFTGAVCNYDAGLSSYSSNVGTSVRNSSSSDTQQYVEAVYTTTDSANTLLFSMTYFTF